MKRVLLLLLLLMPLNKVDAFYCDNSELAELKQIAANVTYRYDYIEKNDDVTFNISLVNLNEKFYMLDYSRIVTYHYDGVEKTISGYNDGEKITFIFYASSGDCEGEQLYSLRVALPVYNKFYDDKVCEGVEHYKLCNKWSSHGLSYEAFVNNVEAYKVEDVIEPEPPIQVEATILEIIIAWVLEYYYVFLILIVIISTVSIYRINKRDNIYK